MTGGLAMNRPVTEQSPLSVDDAKLSLLLEAVARGTPQTMIARGTSMWPALRDGDRVELSAITNAVALGSIVAVRTSEGGFLIHRLCGVRGDGALLVKGDHNPSPDGWFPPEHVVAVVERVARARGLEPVPNQAAGVSRRVRFAARFERRVQRLRRWGTILSRGGLAERVRQAAQPEAEV